MKKILLGSAISFSLGILFISFIHALFSFVVKPDLKLMKSVKITSDISNSFNINDKIIEQKNVSQTNYLNSWKLNITVLGKPSYAMLSRGRENKLLQVNDILEGHKLVKIDKHKVLFSENRDDIWLYMKSNKVINNNIKKVMNGIDIVQMSKKHVDKYLRKPERLAKTINILPEIKGGIFQGFRVKWLMEGTLFYRYGLRVGDLIQKINGKKIVSMADGIYSYQKILDSKKFSISVLRNNKIKEIKYEIVK